MRLAFVTFGVMLFCGLAGATFAADVVLDPGHSVKSPGATSCTGQKEYIYNDALVGMIAKYLAHNGNPVEITRKPGEDLKLLTRASKSAGKQLFISVHHDSVQPQFIQVMSNGNPVSEKAKGYSIFVSRKNPFFNESLAAARKLGKSLRDRGLTPTLHHAEKISGENRPLLDRELGVYAYDNLAVLKNAKSPALLFEAGVLVHPEDEKLVQSPKYRQAVSEAMLETIQAMKNSANRYKPAK